MLTLPAYSSMEYILEGDPAVDVANKAYDRDAYEKSGDMRHLPLIEGVRPSVFHLKRLTNKQLIHVRSERLSHMEQFSEATAYGLTGWTDFPKEPATYEKGPLGDRLSEETMDRISSADLFALLFKPIIWMSRLSPLP